MKLLTFKKISVWFKYLRISYWTKYRVHLIRRNWNISSCFTWIYIQEWSPKHWTIFRKIKTFCYRTKIEVKFYVWHMRHIVSQIFFLTYHEFVVWIATHLSLFSKLLKNLQKKWRIHVIGSSYITWNVVWVIFFLMKSPSFKLQQQNAEEPSEK